MISVFRDFHSRRLALRFAAFIILFSSALAIVVTVVELTLEYREDVTSIDAQMRQIELSYVESLVENLWVMDRERLDTQLQGIVRLPDFVLAEIRVGAVILMRRGEVLDGAGVTRTFDLRRLHRGVMQDLGELVVAASYQGAVDRVLSHLLFRLAANTLKTFLVGAFIFVLFYRLIGRHLDRIVDYASSEMSEKDKPMLFLDRKEPEAGDELSKLIVAINGPRDHLVSLLAMERRRSEDFEKQTLLLRQELLARKKIQRELNLLARVFESSSDAIMLTDADRRIVAVNDAYTHLTGYVRDDVLGCNPRMMASGDTDPSVYRDMWDGLNQSGYWEGTLHDRHRDGRVIPVRVAITAVRDHEDRLVNYMGIFRRAA
ncbi:MAG: PAS domain S-box protein [Hylemonella sp.]|nr:PAS domain S-box protein [Hylemonella sp.]